MFYRINLLSLFDDSSFYIFKNISPNLSKNFFFIIVIFIFSLLIVLVLSGLNFVLFYYFNIKNIKVLTPYECGFIPMTERKLNFNVNFYVVAVLFIIFDLEIVLLFPWVITFLYLGLFGFYVMVIFFIILILGLILEFKSNILSL